MNRQQRRKTEALERKAKPSEAPAAVNPEQQAEQAFQKRLQAMLNNEVKPEGEVIGYFVEQLRGSIGEAQAIEANLQQVNQQLQQLQQRRLVLQGDRDRLVSDIRHWETKNAQPAIQPAAQAKADAKSEVPTGTKPQSEPAAKSAA